MHLGPQDKPVIILKVSLTVCTVMSTKRSVLIGTVDNLLPFLLKNLGFCIVFLTVIYVWRTLFASWLAIIIKRQSQQCRTALQCNCSAAPALAPPDVQTQGDAFGRQLYLRMSISISQSNLCPFLCDRDIDQTPGELNGCSLIM